MRPRLKASLLRRMILAQGMVLALVWVFASTMGLWTVYVSKKGNFDDTLDIVSAALVTLLQDERDPARVQSLARRIEELDTSFTEEQYLKPGEYKPMYQVQDARGDLVFRSANAPSAVLTHQGEGSWTVRWQDESFRVRVREDASHRIRVLVAVPHALMQRMVWRGIRSSPLSFLALFLVLALVTWPLSRLALKPLRRLAASVESRNPWDLSPLEGHARLSETQPLIEALNRLFLRVGGLLKSQRRFIADAAHELRTPLAVIATQAHVLQQVEDTGLRDKAGADLQHGVDRAARLVGQLLALARLETAEALPTRVSVDLAVLAQERIALQLPHALGRRQDLGYEGPPSLMASGSPTTLVQAFDNLLSNAIRHTPEGGRITFRLRREPTEVVLELEDSGPGLPRELYGQVFERFSQHPARHPEGAGLGLAIVRLAVELHGGTVDLSEGREAGGLQVTLRLPLGTPLPRRTP